MKTFMPLTKIAVSIIFFVTLGSVAQASQKLGTVYCSLIEGAFKIIASDSAEITEDHPPYKRLNISKNGYSCGAVGLIADWVKDEKLCYEARIVTLSIGLPDGSLITLDNNRDFSSSLSTSDGHSCECRVKMNKDLVGCP